MPYRDETPGMIARCEQLEAELRMLRRTIRELSAKNAAPRSPRAPPRGRRRTSRVARPIALVVTVLLTCLGWALPRNTYGCKVPPKGGAQNALLAFAGFG